MEMAKIVRPNGHGQLVETHVTDGRLLSERGLGLGQMDVYMLFAYYCSNVPRRMDIVYEFDLLVEKIPAQFMTDDGKKFGMTKLDRFTDDFWNLVYYIGRTKDLQHGDPEEISSVHRAVQHMTECELGECVVCAYEHGHSVAYWLATKLTGGDFDLEYLEPLVQELPEPLARYILDFKRD